MIGAIADDLTGAAEIGGIGLRLGLRAEIIMDSASLADSGADLLCWDTDSRSCRPDEAACRTAEAATQLTAAGCSRIYKKVDSVLRGNVIPELEAILSELHLQRAMLAPANPSLGRIIRDGYYFVRGKPIHETEFGHDPHHPRLSSRALDLVASPGQFELHVCRPGADLPPSGILLLEVATSDDVRAWAACWRPDTLAAGGAEFFGAWLAKWVGEESKAKSSQSIQMPDEPSPLGKRIQELFICGTTSESSREFIQVERESGTPVLNLPRNLVHGAEFAQSDGVALATQAMNALEKHTRVILSVGLPLIREPGLALRMTPLLVQVAAEVIQQANPNRIYAEGGATAIELVRRMRWSRLPVVRELAPGVTVLGVPGGKALNFIIKPGTYIWPASVKKAATR